MSDNKTTGSLDYIAPDFEEHEEMDVIVNVDNNRYSRLFLAPDARILNYTHDSEFASSAESEVPTSRLRNKTALVNTPFTLVPKAEFDDSNLLSIAREAFPYKSSLDVVYTVEDEVIVVFNMNEQLRSLCDEYLKEYRIQHVINPLLKSQDLNDTAILAHWTERGIIIVATRDGLQLANFYNIEVPEDAIYYVLAAYNHIDLDPLEVPLQMSGRIIKESIYCDKLAGFVRTFEWKDYPGKLPPDFQFEPHLVYHLVSY